jgi:hypothetical protein
MSINLVLTSDGIPYDRGSEGDFVPLIKLIFSIKKLNQI